VNPDIRFIGAGNSFRRDDGVGIFIVRHPLLNHLPGVRIVETSGEPTGLMDFWKAAGAVYLFDAVISGNTPGRIYRFNPVRNPLPRDLFRLSTHRMSLVDAIELSRVLNQLPDELIVFGIEGKEMGSGQGLSRETERAALEVIQQVSEEIRLIYASPFCWRIQGNGARIHRSQRSGRNRSFDIVRGVADF